MNSLLTGWCTVLTTDQGLGVFARVMGSPNDHNLVDLYVDAGIRYKGLVSERDSDTAGLGFAVARVSDTTAKLDSDTARLTGGFYSVRRHESVLELTDRAQIAPWWQVRATAG